MKKIVIGIIGLGYWGPNYLRILASRQDVDVRYCCDIDESRNKFMIQYPQIEFIQQSSIIASDPEVDAVIIVTPPDTHFQLAQNFIMSEKHVLVEKPLTLNPDEAERLRVLAAEKSRILMVGHVYVFNTGIQLLKKYIDEGALGDIFYIKAERSGLGPIRRRASVLWDLATHDLSIVHYLLQQIPYTVNAEGESYIQSDVEDFVSLSLRYPKNIFCSIFATWFAPEKNRKLFIVGSKGMAIFDDTNFSEPIKIFDRRLDRECIQATPNYSDHQNLITIGSITSPHIQHSEPLANQVDHFIGCIREDRQPLSNAEQGVVIVSILNAAQVSLKTHMACRVECKLNQSLSQKDYADTIR